MTEKIAILTTGDEITNGDILNTNHRAIAQRLFSNGLLPGMQVSVSDEEPVIEEAIAFLMQHHLILIITGGLGPTSDDRTRYALSTYLKKPLVFHEPTWEAIDARHQKLNIPMSPLNRQQALFPEGASIFSNPHGTASGCLCSQDDRKIYMIPGPPHECLPMFESYILPELQKKYAAHFIQFLWKVFGIPEAQIAEKIEAHLPSFCQVGYRWDFPYVDIKVRVARDHPKRQTIYEKITALVTPYVISPPDQTATEVLCKKIETSDVRILIEDEATGGLLESLIKTPKNAKKVYFGVANPLSPPFKHFKIQGLTEYWEHRPATTATLTISYTADLQTPPEHHAYTLPYRTERVRESAVEQISYWIAQRL